MPPTVQGSRLKTNSDLGCDINRSWVSRDSAHMKRLGYGENPEKVNPDAEHLAAYFYQLFHVSPDQNRKRSDRRKTKKGKQKSKIRSLKSHFGSDSWPLAPPSPPEVHLHGNPSPFAVFATCRSSTLQHQYQQGCQQFMSACRSGTRDSESEDDEHGGEPILKIPKIVGIGLRSVFELIGESRGTNPSLCSKALAALLDILQGQLPEGLKNEPHDGNASLYNLLLHLSTNPPNGYESPPAWTGVACACLVNMALVWGDTGKILKAAAALLMSPSSLVMQEIQMPAVLSAVQRSVHAVLLGQLVRPDWLSHGVPQSSLVDSFAIPVEDAGNSGNLCCDGVHLFLHGMWGLLKIGSGYGGTIRGHVYQHNLSFYPGDDGWMGCAGDCLYYKPKISLPSELLLLDKERLVVNYVATLDMASPPDGPSVLFSDGHDIGIISAAKEDSLVVSMFSPRCIPMPFVSDLPLKLSRKCVDVFGPSPFDSEMIPRSIHSAGIEEETASMATGKDFSLIRTNSGKILYAGKGASLGVRQNICGGSKWTELPVTKSPRIIQCSVGHEGSHAILVADDGAVFFVGTARRGEDADQSKARWQPKPVKPKKMIKMEGKHVLTSACSNGTTALVTREGQLYMFGKDTAHTDRLTGLVSEMNEVEVSQVSLGKAHAVVLTSSGTVYTFGINNKGQCGREFPPHTNKEAAPAAIPMVTACEEECDDCDDDVELNGARGCETGALEGVCALGKHKWKHEQCMVCTVCRECTGYGGSCIRSSNPDRNPGQKCGCGSGDSGCSECGCCRSCGGENPDNDLMVLEVPGEQDVRMRQLIQLDQLFGGDRGRERAAEQIQRRLDERVRHHRGSRNQVKAKIKVKLSARIVGDTIPVAGVLPGVVALTNDNNEACGSDTGDGSRIASLPPHPLSLRGDVPVIQVACGMHHSVLLLESGEVYTFGSNIHGQLGLGDLTTRGAPVKVSFPSSFSPISQIAAGSNHTAFLTTKGDMLTCGAYQKGQLGRSPPPTTPTTSNATVSSPKALWYSIPGQVSQLGPHHGRRVTWIGASGDMTFVKVDESLVNAHNLTHSTVVANKGCIMVHPHQNKDQPPFFRCLVISRRDGSCSSFNGDEQMDLSEASSALDPLYNILWSLVNGRVQCYHLVASEVNPLFQGQSNFLPDILRPEMTLPSASDCTVRRSQAALHLLACIDTLTQAHELNVVVREKQADQLCSMRLFAREDFVAVNRFESHGGGWGYSGHSIEAVRFMCDTDVLLGGFGIFGGRGEYSGKVKLFDLGMEGGEQEGDGEVLSETEDVVFECGPRQKQPMLFDEPITLQANRWYVAWARVSGPSSDCGSSGQSMVTTEDQVVFYFKSSKKSNNGTDVNAGQIPQILYRILTTENQSSGKKLDPTEPVYVLSREFALSVSVDCFRSLLSLLYWSWSSFKSELSDVLRVTRSKVATGEQDLCRLVYISRSCLRLVRIYTNEIYSNGVFNRKPCEESLHLAECVEDVRSLLRQVLSDPLSRSCTENEENDDITEHGDVRSLCDNLMECILSECQRTFVFCFHAFYPTGKLKWNCLCDLLATMDKGGEVALNCDRLLSAVMAALCSPTLKLRSIFPNMCEASTPHQEALEDNRTLGMEINRCPLLVEYMTNRTPMEIVSSSWQFNDLVLRLLRLPTIQVRQALEDHPATLSPALVQHACHLTATIVAEMAVQATGNDVGIYQMGRQVLHCTPSRFTRTNQSRTWNTGNGSPDALCFNVNRPGIVIAGVCVYGGAGTYEYEVEILDEGGVVSVGANDSSIHSQKWSSLELVRGTFGPEDCLNDIAEIRFEKAVVIKENKKYAIRLRNHGGRTSNGDGGLLVVKGPDGTNFTFSTCSLSFNGTNQSRGQMPNLLYYSYPQDSESQSINRALAQVQMRTSLLSLLTSICRSALDLLQLGRACQDLQVLGSSSIVTSLLPMVLAYVGPVAQADPKSAVQVLSLIQEVLPHVVALNNSAISQSTVSMDEMTVSAPPPLQSHYAWVESPHPYKAATVANYRVTFPESVCWMTLEFDSRCGTAQSEDVLQLFIPNRVKPRSGVTSVQVEEDEGTPDVPFWPVLRKFNGSQNWPKTAVVLPGNEVMFSLETASDYVRDEKACFYGFRCMVVGLEWSSPSGFGLRHLEMELAYLGGMCSAMLISKDLQLPPITGESLEDESDEISQAVFEAHSQLLGRGFALAHPPTVMQAMEGVLPYSVQSKERLFLRDFISCTPGTSGGRLARWLQPDPAVEPQRCEVAFAKEEIRAGWPFTVTITTRDQYGDVVHVPSLRVDVRAIPVDRGGQEGRGNNRGGHMQPDAMTFGGHPAPSLQSPYEVSVRDRMRYMAISMMKAYENYSFEELRVVSPSVRRPSETLLVRPNGDGTYSATWTPGGSGWYSLHVTIDGYPMEQVYKLEVKESPQGSLPLSASAPLNQPPPSSSHSAHAHSKLRRFATRNSAGLRIRAHPSLQSEQIGVVRVDGTIAFVDEVHNDDGVWVRLTLDTLDRYVGMGVGEGWCLQYNQHLGKTLLVPVEEPKSLSTDETLLMQKMPNSANKESKSKQAKKTGGPGVYQVVKCGASGHNVRSKPNLKAPPVGMLVLGNQVSINDDQLTSEGTWVRLDVDSCQKFCFSPEGEAWSLATSWTDVTYLQHKGNMNNSQLEDLHPRLVSESAKGFDFSFHPPHIGNAASFNFGGAPFVPPPHVNNISDVHPLPSATAMLNRSKSGGKFSAFHKWLKSDEGSSSNWVTLLPSSQPEKAPVVASPPRDIPPELMGVSVKDLVRAIGESRANGNGVTPPGTPPGRMSRSSSPAHQASLGRSSSSSPMPGRQETPSSSPAHASSPNSRVPINATTLLTQTVESRSGTPQTPLHTHSDTSALLSSLTRDLSQSPSCASLTTRSDSPISGCGTPSRKISYDESPSPKVQTGTQTSPESVPKNHFNIGTGGEQTQRLSPKVARRERGGKQHHRSRRESVASPRPSKPPPTPSTTPAEPLKESLSPSIAECLRATFAAFLWQEGVVHDAMAASSFLKFHPDLPKQGTTVVTRHPPSTRRGDMNRALQRHSVEVIGTSYLSQLEPLTKSGNENRPTIASITKESSAVIKEEGGADSPSHTPSPHTVSFMPPALRCLVLLWDSISTNCLQAILQHLLLPSPPPPAHSTPHTHLPPPVPPPSNSKERNRPFYRQSSVDPIILNDVMCEVCQQGMVDNGFGQQVDGWKNCEGCKEKRRNKTTGRRRAVAAVPSPLRPPLPSPSAQESHLVMKENALFLLDLDNGSSTCQQETVPTPSNTNNNPFQCLQALGVRPSQVPSLQEEMMLAAVANPVPPQPIRGYVTSGGRPLSQGPSMMEESVSVEGASCPVFHRSISMASTQRTWGGTQPTPHNPQEGRKRNSSSGEGQELGTLLLCSPSPALQRLVPQVGGPVQDESELPALALEMLSRPTMHFILQKHNLQALQNVLRKAVRKAACRVHAMQALTWLLRNVSQPTCIHDLLWWFVSSLAPSQEPVINQEDQETPENKTDKKEDQDLNWVCDHPLSGIGIGGSLPLLPSTFHQLLQTVSDLMPLLPMGSAIQQMAVACWGLRFRREDHGFLHRCHVFSNFSKILSRTDEDSDELSISVQDSHHSAVAAQGTSCVETLTDVTGNMEVKASSRQAMVASLMDSSTETFWESGEEDRNKTKILTLQCSANCQPRMLYVHIDNCRDLGNKVSNVVFKCGSNSDDLKKCQQLELESRFSGWVCCPLVIATESSLVRVELKGPDNSLRVRQIRLLGTVLCEELQVPPLMASSNLLQHRNCEAEALKVFRLIVSQVFGRLLSGVEEGVEVVEEGTDNDLKEHMVGILFSRSRLTHLQKQVCEHIVKAIGSEAHRVREEWEFSLCSSPSHSPKESGGDNYCFEMLSMVLALSGSGVGRNYLAHQEGLITDLLGLLHTGSARVQRQVVLLLKRILPEVPPPSLAAMLGVERMPPDDFGGATSQSNADESGVEEVEEEQTMGLLDVFLGCIAKALTVQVKSRSREGGGGHKASTATVSLATSLQPRLSQGPRWWLRGCSSRKLAEVIIQLIRDMAEGHISLAWSSVTKCAIADALLSLARLPDSSRVSTDCLRAPSLWLALAALCVLHPEHAEKMSSAQWTHHNAGEARPTCDNHDDGETPAVIQCARCGNLCVECDRILHLPRRCRYHSRHVCKEEESAVRVDLHEGCGRLKLFWVLLLADAATLKAMVEFREGPRSGRLRETSSSSHSGSLSDRTVVSSGSPVTGKCRFCGVTGSSGLLAIGNVCADQECQEHSRMACHRVHSCGHLCGGVQGEEKCLPCLIGCTAIAEDEPALRQDADDMCMICFTEALSCAPAVQLGCGHVFHLHCCRLVLARKWAGPRINFNFARCPICKADMEHPALEVLLTPIRQLRDDVRRKALMRLEYEGGATGGPLGGKSSDDVATLAMERYAYYVCFKCSKTYFGGEARCELEAGGGAEEYNASELVCGACSDVSRAQMCPKHGTDFLEYKCRYCCSVAVFFCFGTTHFCNACHEDFQRVTNLPKHMLPSCPAGPKAKQMEGEECPLHVQHPPTGEEFALGCGVCRNAHTF